MIQNRYQPLLVNTFILFIIWLSLVMMTLKSNTLSLIVVGWLYLLLGQFNTAWSRAQNNLNDSYLVSILAALLPLAMLWILYYPALNGWWTGDDPVLIHAAFTKGICAHFYEPTVWQELNVSFLMPWLTFSLGLDNYLFGLNPKGFYWHHLLAFSIVILLGYRVLQWFFCPLIASLILSLLVASVPASFIVSYLMVRHYLEGLGFSLLALWLYLHAVHTKRISWAFGGALFYLLATTAKEIYVPLVMVLPWLPIATPRLRWKYTIPFVGVAICYTLWRTYMLKPERLITGYGFEHYFWPLNWGEMSNVLQKIATSLGWNNSWQILVFVLALLPSLLFLFQRQFILKRSGYLMLWLIIIIGPLLPVLKNVVPRFLFLPMLMMMIMIGISLQYLLIPPNALRKTLILSLSLALLLVSVIIVEPVNHWHHTYTHRLRQEGELLLTGHDPRTIVFINEPVALVQYYLTLQWLRKDILKLADGPQFCFDKNCLCDKLILPHYQFYQYDSTQLVLQPFDPETQCDLSVISYQLSMNHYPLSRNQ